MKMKNIVSMMKGICAKENLEEMKSALTMVDEDTAGIINDTAELSKIQIQVALRPEVQVLQTMIYNYYPTSALKAMYQQMMVSTISVAATAAMYGDEIGDLTRRGIEAQIAMIANILKIRGAKIPEVDLDVEPDPDPFGIMDAFDAEIFEEFAKDDDDDDDLSEDFAE